MELTREQIEEWRNNASASTLDMSFTPAEIVALCAMALRAAPVEGVTLYAGKEYIVTFPIPEAAPGQGEAVFYADSEQMSDWQKGVRHGGAIDLRVTSSSHPGTCDIPLYTQPAHGEREAVMPKFAKTFCSQCGGERGPGNEGFSHCSDHQAQRADSEQEPVVLGAQPSPMPDVRDYLNALRQQIEITADAAGLDPNEWLTEAQAEVDVGELVDRFLGWPLPASFGPDCGISFTKPNHPNSWPVGTNLFTAIEARQMFEYVLAKQPSNPMAKWPFPQDYTAGFAQGLERAAKVCEEMRLQMEPDKSAHNHYTACVQAIKALASPDKGEAKS